MEFQQSINQFFEIGRRKYSKRTLQLYIRHLNWFCRFIDNKNIEQIDLLKDVLGYSEKLEKSGWSDNTINLAMTALRQLWKLIYSLERQLNISLPFMVEAIPIKSGVIPRSHRPITAEEFSKLSEVIVSNMDTSVFKRLRDHAMFCLMYDTGVRVSELTSLNVTNLNMDRRSAKVITRKRRDHVKYREVYWTFETQHALKEYLEHRKHYTDGDILFFNAINRKRITTRSVNRIMQDYCRMADLDRSGLTSHSFRHGVGKRAAENQMYPPLLQALLGHRNPNSSQIYYNIHNESLRKEYHEKIGDWKDEKSLQCIFHCI